jgi:hypothetical protein
MRNVLGGNDRWDADQQGYNGGEEQDFGSG